VVQPKLLIPWEEVLILPTTGMIFKSNKFLLGPEQIPCTIAHTHAITLSKWSEGGITVEDSGIIRPAETK
jgi:hypothetical protein